MALSVLAQPYYTYRFTRQRSLSSEEDGTAAPKDHNGSFAGDHAPTLST